VRKREVASTFTLTEQYLFNLIHCNIVLCGQFLHDIRLPNEIIDEHGVGPTWKRNQLGQAASCGVGLSHAAFCHNLLNYDFMLPHISEKETVLPPNAEWGTSRATGNVWRGPESSSSVT
jgi:hypothetical protein